MSTNDNDEGTDFVASFMSTFGKRSADDRLRAERIAGRTPAQREAAKRPKKIKQINFRATIETEKLLGRLTMSLDLSQSDVIAQALHHLAAAHGQSHEGGSA